MTTSFNVCVLIHANIAIVAQSATDARDTVERLIADSAIIRAGSTEFIVEESEVVGVFDANWNELED